MREFKKILILFLFVCFVAMPLSQGYCSQEASDQRYYFGSLGVDPSSADNNILVRVTGDGNAQVITQLHAIANHPAGVGKNVSILIPYSLSDMSIIGAQVSREKANYTVESSEGKTLIQVAVPELQDEVFLQAAYTVSGVYNQGKFNMKFQLSSFATEVSVNIMIDDKTVWIDRRSLEMSPKASESTYFFVAEEALPFSLWIVLSNLQPKLIELSFKTHEAPISLENLPYNALFISIIPGVVVLMVKLVNNLFFKERLGVLKIAYRNLTRRLGRFLLTIISVSIPSILIVVMMTQGVMAEKILGPAYSQKIEWHMILILCITIVIGGFQVINTMLSSILERIKELGVMKAIGFSPSFIVKMVAVESTLIGLMAGVVGSTLGITSLIFSYGPFYGSSISNEQFTYIMSRAFGGIDPFNPLNNPWYKSLIISTFTSMALSFILGAITNAMLVAGVIPFVYLMFSRPYDPFLIGPLLEMFPTIIVNILLTIAFSLTLSVLAGFYAARKAGKIKPTEAMRHV